MIRMDDWEVNMTGIRPEGATFQTGVVQRPDTYWRAGVPVSHLSL